MEKYYVVTRNGTSCGKVSVIRQGLYYSFQCRCILKKDDIYRLILSQDNLEESLGILVPSGDSFVLATRIPAKRLPEGEWRFHITSKRNPVPENFAPISPDEPFSYISRLKDSFLIYHNGQLGIRI